MSKFGISQGVKRREDSRFLKGEGSYVDDIKPTESLHAHFFLSPIAHAKITTLDVTDAKASPGVVAVYTAQDLVAGGMKNRMVAELLPSKGSKIPDPARTILAEEKVRFVGEPVAIVIAETINQAKDAVELIEFDFEELDAHLALELGGEDLHDEAPGNISFHWAKGNKEAVDKVFCEAPHVVSLQVDDNRVIANSIEPRGCFAEWENNRLHMCMNGQGVWVGKDELANLLGLTEDKVRVTTPDVGGGFGMKGFNYPENFAVAQSAKMLGKTIHWMGTRSEAMLNDNAGRDLTTKVEAAFDDNYKIVGYRVITHCNIGAYNSYYAQFIQTDLFRKVISGVYDIPNIYFEVTGIFTNTAPVDAYRGAGRPEGIFVMERLIDHASRELGIDSIELRRRNFIKPSQFPYKNFAHETVDVGNFEKVMDRAVVEADIPGFDKRKEQSREDNKLRGLGICYYIETILGDPSETTKLEFCEDGMVNVYVGTQSNGQGHETAYSQILHERSGIPFDKIRIVQGDSDLIKTGGGTGGSRSVTTQGTSINGTADKMIEKFKPFVAEELDTDESLLEYEEGAFKDQKSNKFLGIMEAGSLALSRQRDDLITTEVTTEIRDKSFPNGAHICEVEVDPETGYTKVVKYTVVDDLGVIINPVLAQGQVHGGVVQGIGQILTEHVGFDEYGQLLTGTFMDYGMPRADNVPFIEFHSEPTPSINNPIGMKGCGEAGTIGALAAVTNAVQDALWDKGIKMVQAPLTPTKVWDLLNG
ncbi:MAG: xanthine dehydrogenase family protein molybdopterin-binding subunit [Rhodobacteraceae bacterium]|nr:xanthine dehydrogenase family protein molybdopterin-binding subunit [Paracoccaceae bacterium]